MKTTSSPVQVGLGYIIGLLLQPVSLWIVMDQFSGRPLKQWGFAIFPFFAAYASILQVPRSVFCAYLWSGASPYHSSGGIAHVAGRHTRGGARTSADGNALGAG
jgi:hypothetical protein